MSKKTGRIISEEMLRTRLVYPYDLKVSWAKQRIRQWYYHYHGKVYVAFSGGLDSTALLHLVREEFPDVLGIFVDTGLEYPEIRDFAMATENVKTVRPKMAFPAVLKKYGYPVVSKRVAQYVGEVQRSKSETATKHLRLTGYKSNGEYNPMGKIPDKWQYLCQAPFKISHRCCDVMKKKPANKIAKELGLYAILGTRVAESKQRELTYIQYGCNGFDMRYPGSTPLALWSDADVRQYLREHDISYCCIYDMGYNRTGCMFCMFGVHMEKEPNRFQRMAQTHPKQYRYCMDNLGLRDVLKYLNISSEPTPTLFAHAMDLRLEESE